jgi:hypothetical protein
MKPLGEIVLTPVILLALEPEEVASGLQAGIVGSKPERPPVGLTNPMVLDPLPPAYFMQDALRRDNPILYGVN